MVGDKGINNPHGQHFSCINSPIAKGIDGKISSAMWAHRPCMSDIIASITEDADGGGRRKELGLESSSTNSSAFEIVRSNSNVSSVSCPSLWDAMAELSSMDTLDATQEEECGNDVAAANAGMSPSGFSLISNFLTFFGDYLSKALVGSLCVS